MTFSTESKFSAKFNGGLNTPLAHMQLPGLFILKLAPACFLSIAGTKHGAEELAGGKGFIMWLRLCAEFKSRIVKHVHTQARLVKEAGRKRWGGASYEFHSVARSN